MIDWKTPRIRLPKVKESKDILLDGQKGLIFENLTDNRVEYRIQCLSVKDRNSNVFRNSVDVRVRRNGIDSCFRKFFSDSSEAREVVKDLARFANFDVHRFLEKVRDRGFLPASFKDSKWTDSENYEEQDGIIGWRNWTERS